MKVEDEDMNTNLNLVTNSNAKYFNDQISDQNLSFCSYIHL